MRQVFEVRITGQDRNSDPVVTLRVSVIMHKTEVKVLNYINENNMIAPGDAVLLAVSGGSDSVCMLNVMSEVSKSLKCSLAVFHFNHMLREAASNDERFVEDICACRKIPFYRAAEDVAAKAAEGKYTIEEAARLLRYKALEKCRVKIGASSVAVAHHRMDQAETVLFSMCRGTGLQGLGGIRPVRDRIIRPLLCLDKSEIEEYISEKALKFVTDDTNGDDSYLRNYIRHNVIPLFEENVNRGAIAHICDAAKMARDAWDYIIDNAREAYKDCLIKSGRDGKVLDIARLEKCHGIIAGEVIRLSLEDLAGTKKNIGRVHIGDVLSLLDKQSGRRISLPYGITAVREFDTLRMYKADQAAADPAVLKGDEQKVFFRVSKEELGRRINDEPGPDAAGMTEKIRHDGKSFTVTTEVFDFDPEKDSQNIPQKGYTKWIDYDKIANGLTLRTVKGDDHFYFDSEHKKTAAAYFAGRKIPRTEWEKSLVFTDEDHILFFPGGRMSCAVRVGEDSKKVLKVTMYPDDE